MEAFVTMASIENCQTHAEPVQNITLQRGEVRKCWSLTDFPGKNIQQSNAPSFQRITMWSYVVLNFLNLSGKRWIV